MRLTVLNDNRPGPGLRNKWGWSLFIETDEANALFDADTSPSILCSNAEKLGVDLSTAAFAVLSHEHWDHYGGMACVAKARPGLTVYVPPGLHLWAKDLPLKLVENRSGLNLSDRYALTPPLRAGPLFEHALSVRVGSRIIVVVGCSHPGVDRLALEAARATGLRPILVIGGFHGPSPDQLDRLARISDYIAPAHCSGEEAYRYVESKYPEKLVAVRTGSVLEISERGRIRLLRP
ncbi:MAG: MBL fold metallo-hydrolase [Desulfurococcales archaeon]|nr:MBL fold metallo-hydrolase [Desulfurococcales archaeon]